ncbi:MAG TPA: hypothetical protein VIN60_07330, partial [Anaerolineales bacterium]
AADRESFAAQGRIARFFDGAKKSIQIKVQNRARHLSIIKKTAGICCDVGEIGYSKGTNGILNNRLSKVILGVGRQWESVVRASLFPVDSSGGSYETSLDSGFNDFDSGADRFVYPRLGFDI